MTPHDPPPPTSAARAHSHSSPSSSPPLSPPLQSFRSYPSSSTSNQSLNLQHQAGQGQGQGMGALTSPNAMAGANSMRGAEDAGGAKADWMLGMGMGRNGNGSGAGWFDEEEDDYAHTRPQGGQGDDLFASSSPLYSPSHSNFYSSLLSPSPSSRPPAQDVSSLLGYDPLLSPPPQQQQVGLGVVANLPLPSRDRGNGGELSPLVEPFSPSLMMGQAAKGSWGKTMQNPTSPLLDRYHQQQQQPRSPPPQQQPQQSSIPFPHHPQPPQEEISTIFVVGFPDDMLEREFINIFTFSSGFEGATLKVPFGSSSSNTAAEEDEGGEGRKIIGFARFGSRVQAMEAREVLNGRRVDVAGGNLKAEMAKKNLHLMLNGTGAGGSGSVSSNGDRERRGGGGERGEVQGRLNPVLLAELGRLNAIQNHSPHITTSNNDRPTVIREYYDDPLSPSQHQQQPSPIISTSTKMGNLSISTKSPSLGYGSNGTTTTNVTANMNGGIPRTQNPADMNAPKNTLYVGGLPAVLPSLTGPFSAAHLEDSLRNAFSRCQGFRRLCFRSKSNGPIVFVEFDDVIFATRALQEMYGNTLNGLVKGGIRLSYSKNPLGVRSGTIPSHSPVINMSDGRFGESYSNSPTSPYLGAGEYQQQQRTTQQQQQQYQHAPPTQYQQQPQQTFSPFS